MGNRHPELCPNCPYRHLQHIAETESYTKTKAEQSTINLCSKLREIAKQLGLGPCPHYPRTERIDLYVAPNLPTPKPPEPGQIKRPAEC